MTNLLEFWLNNHTLLDEKSKINKEHLATKLLLAGISTLRTLIEFKGVRKDESFEKEFLRGSYGAVAYLNEIENIIITYVNQTDELPKA